MSDSYVVQALDWQGIDIELETPFAISGGSHDLARVVVVRLSLDDGATGIGEAAPLPAYNAETVTDVERALAQIQRCVEGQSFNDWRELSMRVAAAVESRRAVPPSSDTAAPSYSGAARCAFETALVDALARRAGVSLSSWFGEGSGQRLETDVTIPIGSVEVAREAAASWWRRGFRILKIKVGGAEDLARVLAVHEVVPLARLILDGNAGLSPEAAAHLVQQLRARGADLALFEQPVARGDWSGLRHVAAAGARLALDESVVTARDAEQAVHELGPEHVINIKLMKAGIVEALAVAAVAKRTGMGLMIGGNVESALAMTTSACFAAGVGGFEFFDLDTPLFLRNSPFVGGFVLRGAELDLSGVTAGHGVSLPRP